MRQEFAAAQAEETALTNSLKATKTEIQKAETDVEKFQKLLGETDRDLVALQGQLQNEENSGSQSHETITRLSNGLPEVWQMAVEAAGLSEQL
jgi:hypothetical protein